MQPNDPELLAAAADAIALAVGHPPRNPHPLAAELAHDVFSKVSLALGLRDRAAAAQPETSGVMALGMRTTDFARLLAQALAPAAAQKFGNLATHRVFCKVFEAPNYREQTLPATLDLADLPQNTEFAEIQALTAKTTDGGTARLSRYAANLLIARQVITNDESESIAALAESAGIAAARMEARAVYARLESDEPMHDGELPFHELHGNLIAEALDSTTLAQAAALLRTQRTTAGHLADLPAAHLLVEPALEFSARKLIHESGLPLTLTASAHLPTGRWYLLADPAIHASICVLTLRGSANPVSIEPVRTPGSRDGVLLRATADLGAALMSRVGIVRGGV